MSDEEKIKYRDAFPKDYDLPTYFTSKHAISMELRDYFAAKAMQGIIEYSPWVDHIDMDKIAQLAYKQADAMMKAREA
jgi:hypothetical protein